MKIIRHRRDLTEDLYNSVLVMGNFDGIHKGHRKLLDYALSLAKFHTTKIGVMSFYPHPATYFKNVKKVKIQTLSDKVKMLEDLGIDFLYYKLFNQEFTSLKALEFIDQYLVQSLKINHLIVGENFNFGKDREGNAELIEKKAAAFGFTFKAFSLEKIDGEDISSSRIRHYLSLGKLDIANKMLGYNYQISARVVHGRKQGRVIGFKTANLILTNHYAIKYGVYAVLVHIEGRKYKAVLNFGVRPTIDDSKLEIYEAHIFDYSEDLYGKKITVEFINFIRKEIKFVTFDDLRKQINEDCDRAKEILAN